VSSPQRGKNSKAEKIRRRGMEKREGRVAAERRRAPEKSGSLPRGKSRCYYGTTTVQKLGKNFLAAFISFFQQEDKPHQSSASNVRGHLHLNP